MKRFRQYLLAETAMRSDEVGERVMLLNLPGRQLSQILAASEKVASTMAEISAASA